jgi:lysophospholipase L1-like esterase
MRFNQLLASASVFLLASGFAYAAAPQHAPATHWVGTWAAAPMANLKTPAHFGVEGGLGTTLREVIHISLGGAAVVAFGDSITDGAHSTRDKNARWPDVLAARLAANPRTAALGVLNEGIGGNRILHDNTGPSALARFDRDVLAQTGVKYLIVLEAINDIGHGTNLKNPAETVSAEDLIAGYMQMITRAHTHGIRVYLATVTPFVGAGYQSPAGERDRETLNAWIRSNPLADGYIDFDKTTADPVHAGVFLPADDSGDHLHPSDAGYKAIGESIDLSLFTR